MLTSQHDTDVLRVVDLTDSIEEAEINKNVASKNVELDAKRDKLLQEYQKEMDKLRNLHER